MKTLITRHVSSKERTNKDWSILNGVYFSWFVKKKFMKVFVCRSNNTRQESWETCFACERNNPPVLEAVLYVMSSTSCTLNIYLVRKWRVRYVSAAVGVIWWRILYFCVWEASEIVIWMHGSLVIRDLVRFVAQLRKIYQHFIWKSAVFWRLIKSFKLFFLLFFFSKK